MSDYLPSLIGEKTRKIEYIPFEDLEIMVFVKCAKDGSSYLWQAYDLSLHSVGMHHFDLVRLQTIKNWTKIIKETNKWDGGEAHSNRLPASFFITFSSCWTQRYFLSLFCWKSDCLNGRINVFTAVASHFYEFDSCSDQIKLNGNSVNEIMKFNKFHGNFMRFIIHCIWIA